MKKIALLLLSIISLAFSSEIKILWSSLNRVNNNKDVWDIESFGFVSRYDNENAELKTSAVRIKWNVRKGRIWIDSQGINTEDEYIIRLFDKDTLRIDYVITKLKADQFLADSSYIIPKELVKDVKFAEIMAFSENVNSRDWVPKYRIECKDGYKVKEPDDDYYLASTDLDRYLIGIAMSECVKIPEDVVEEVQEVQEVEEDVTEDIPESSNNSEQDDDNCWGDPNGDYFCE